MLLLYKFSVFFIIFAAFTTIPAFAENSTPFNEWDFDILGAEVSQNPHDLEEMVISVSIVYNGDMLNGTANVSANVTDPTGSSFVHVASIPILEIDESDTLKIIHHMNYDGLYTIDIKVTPPEKPYLFHVFDAETLAFLVEPYGREKDMGTIATDSDEMTSYKLKNSTVKYREMVHAVITLPKVHTLEKITLTNENKLVKEFPVYTKDIYMKTYSHYKNMKINLVKNNNLFSSADAQDNLLDYVNFYVKPRDVCKNVYCYNVDVVEESEEFPIWMLVFLGGFAIIPFLLRRKSINDDVECGKPYLKKRTIFLI